MSQRITTLLASKDLGPSGTEVIDINMKDQISRISCRWRAKNVTVSVMLDNTLSCISKVELVDGSNVLFSTSGERAQGINRYEEGALPHNTISLTVADYFEGIFNLNFGKFLFDPDYALRPDMLKNPQLKITWNEATVNASVIVNSFEVIAYVDDSPAGGGAKGFIQTRDHFQFPMAASAYEYIEMPLDGPLRAIYIQGKTAARDTAGLFSNFKIDIDGGSQVPLDVPAALYIDLLKSRYGPIAEKITLDAVVTAKTLFVNTADENEITIDYDGTAFVTAQSLFAVATYTGEKIALAASIDIKADTAHVLGFVPHGVFPIEFGRTDRPETWLSTAGRKSIRLILQQSADATSSDTCYIVTQQPVMY